jgi:SAM-dependent methyltransferase
MALSTDKILNTAVALVADAAPPTGAAHLDIGSGHGDLIALLRDRFRLDSSACDYTADLMRLDGQRVDIADLNHDPLPYPDARFDLVTCTEVIEHVENFRRLLRECHRVLKPGGTLVVSTPNILNMKSRLRYLLFGFWNLFGPLPVADREKHSTGGHINPVTSFHLNHALLEAGFADLRLTVDKHQRTSVFLLAVFGLPVVLFGRWLQHRERTKYKTVNTGNWPHVAQMNSYDVLTGRTIVARARKPA